MALLHKIIVKFFIVKKIIAFSIIEKRFKLYLTKKDLEVIFDQLKIFFRPIIFFLFVILATVINLFI